MWRQASLPAIEGGILPPGKKLRRAKRLGFTEVSSVATPIRRAGSHGSTSAKMADATFFRPALKKKQNRRNLRNLRISVCQRHHPKKNLKKIGAKKHKLSHYHNEATNARIRVMQKMRMGISVPVCVTSFQPRSKTRPNTHETCKP
jgi:hypothetical protein